MTPAPRSHPRVADPANADLRQARRHAMGLLLWCFAPLLGWVLLTVALALAQPWVAFERQLAPGESLAWQGLAICAGVTLGLLWRLRRAAQLPLVRRGVTAMAVVGGLLSWPIITLGPLPSLNGLWLDHERTTPMQVTRLSQSLPKGRSEPHSWVHVQPLAPPPHPAALPAGRLLVDAERFATWQAQQVSQVQVTHARGILGARVVTQVRP